jgi:hypothetical protein
MRRLFLLLIILAVSGCDGFLDEAAKDWRGDNMQMRGFGGSDGLGTPGAPRSRD